MLKKRKTAGAIWISKDGILGPYTIEGPGIYYQAHGIDLNRLEDPVMWYSGGLDKDETKP